MAVPFITAMMCNISRRGGVTFVIVV